MKRIFLFLVLSTCLLACSKDEKDHSYWANLVNEKLKEIQILSQKVSCTNINDFEIVTLGYNTYALNHPSIKQEFDRLNNELSILREKANRTIDGNIMYNNDIIMEPPIPPIRKACKDGKATLILIQDLDLAETNVEIQSRKKEIDDFYKDVPCSDVNDWGIIAILKDCCPEFVAINNKIKRNEFFILTNTYSQLVRNKQILENKTCTGMVCEQKRPTIACESGKLVLKPAAL